jgi:hypothetical protein
MKALAGSRGGLIGAFVLLPQMHFTAHAQSSGTVNVLTQDYASQLDTNR